MLSNLIILISFFISTTSAKDFSKDYLDVRSLEDLPFDQNDRLSSTFVLFSEIGCDVNWDQLGHLSYGIISSEMFALFGFEQLSEYDCRAVCVFQGAPKHLVHAVFDSQRYDGSTDPNEWFKNIRTKERGWISYYPSDLNIYWVDDAGSRKMVALLSPGEKNTVWLSSQLGHNFVIHDSQTDEYVASTHVLFDGVQIIGEVIRPDLSSTPKPEDVLIGVENTLATEFDRSFLVQRTFTSLGFDKGRLPDDIFCSMLTYYYNNYANVYLEEWVGMFHVNWWEADNW